MRGEFRSHNAVRHRSQRLLAMTERFLCVAAIQNRSFPGTQRTEVEFSIFLVEYLWYRSSDVIGGEHDQRIQKS